MHEEDQRKQVYNNDPIRQFQQDIFLDQPGKKTALIFSTNRGQNVNLDNYLNNLRENNVSLCDSLEADITKSLNFPQNRLDSLPVHFEIDLRSPDDITTVRFRFPPASFASTR